jgi:beta-mannosidase
MCALHIRLLDENGQILDSKTRKIGLRRSRMVMNEGSWRLPNKFPKSRSDAPATLEINGRRIFAKGSNWVNARLYPGSVTEQDYRQLLQLVRDGNMNILRIWGGGFVNHEAFFDLCDEMGIMVWQEFPLACNEYPDDDAYLKVLEQEATSIVRRLRTHPSVVLWCGGNELFNNWSRMTDQHHALRLLDRVCYTEDRFTPFIMTSPLNGMAHGPYINYDPNLKSEYISVFVDSQNTAYTEFGSPGAAAAEYIKQYMSEEDFRDCQPDNPVWKAHHAFDSGFYKDTWLRQTEADYYFGGWDGVEDLCAKTQFIQTMCYRSYFEEMRKQWPHCSMALNWCFNEPWPCFANNSLVSYPVQPKSAYYAVQAALRPQLASLRIDRHLWRNGEEFEAQVWLLSDALEALTDLTVEVSYEVDGKQPVIWGSLHLPELAAQQSRKCGSISFPLPGDNAYKFKVILKVQGHPEMDSEYTYLCRPRQVVNTKGMLNV